MATVRRRPLPLGGLTMGTADLCEVLGLTEMQLRRMADALGIDQHPGVGGRAMWSPDDQRLFGLYLAMVAGGLTKGTAAMVAVLIPGQWSGGWAVVLHEDRQVVHCRTMRELAVLVGEFATTVPLGPALMVDVSTGGRL